MNTDWFLWHDPYPFMAHQLISKKKLLFHPLIYTSTASRAYHQPTSCWPARPELSTCTGAWLVSEVIGGKTPLLVVCNRIQNRWSEIIPNKYDVFNLNLVMKPCSNSRIFTRNFTSISQASTASLEHMFSSYNHHTHLCLGLLPHPATLFMGIYPPLQGTTNPDGHHKTWSIFLTP